MPELNAPVVAVSAPEAEPVPVSEPAPHKVEMMMKCTKYEALDTAVQVEENGKLHTCVRKVHYYSFERMDPWNRGTPGCEVVLRSMENAFFDVGKTYKLELT
jgi:hypothetical protein